MSYAHTVTVGLPFEEAVSRIRELLSEQGFGVLTEIDVKATLTAKLGPEHGQAIGDYLILGACNPALSERAITADPDMGVLLPCNVVIRRSPAATSTVVQSIDPQTMVELSDAPAMAEIAADVDVRLRAALQKLDAASPARQ